MEGRLPVPAHGSTHLRLRRQRAATVGRCFRRAGWGNEMIIYCWHAPEHGLIRIGSTVSAAGARVRMLEYGRLYGVTCDPLSLRAFPVAPKEGKLSWRGGWPMPPSGGLRGMEESVRFSVRSRLKLLLARDDYLAPDKLAMPHMSKELLYLGPCSYQRAVDFVDAAIHAYHQDDASPSADPQMSELSREFGKAPPANGRGAGIPNGGKTKPRRSAGTSTANRFEELGGH
jgi:hypothetical protein